MTGTKAFRSLIVLLGASMLGAASGCLPAGIVRYYKPDPRQKEAVRFSSIGEAGIVLADGRRFEVSGVDLGFWGQDELLTEDIRSDRAALLKGQLLLIRDGEPGKAVLTRVNSVREARFEGLLCPLMPLKHYYPYDVPLMILIPIIVDGDPRWDVGERLLENGLAKFREDDRLGFFKACAYRSAQEQAKRQKKGLWMDPPRRLVDLLRRGHEQAALEMVHAGADPNAQEGDDTALSLAITLNHIPVAHALLDAGADPNVKRGDRPPPLCSACRREPGDLALVRHLLDKGADPNARDSYGTTALMDAANFGSKQVASLLIDRKARLDDVDDLGRTALAYAAMSDKPDVIRLLVRRGADVNKRGRQGLPPLAGAAGKGNLEMVRWLVEHGARINEPGVLASAVNYGNVRVTEFLVQHGADVNLRDDQGWRPLRYARLGNRTRIVEYLLAKGAKE